MGHEILTELRNRIHQLTDVMGNRDPSSENPRPTDGTSLCTLVLIDSHNANHGFSTDYLSSTILPYVDALIQIQHTLDAVHERPPADIRILGIRYGSITVDVTGGIRDTVELVLNWIVPYRRRTERQRAELAVKEMEINLQQKETEVAKAKAALEQDSAVAEEKVNQEAAESEKRRAEVDLLRG